ncbi:hypothetical protein DH2020_029005 [Rehmannia glutinosa]|uniref:TFIIS N-terminal domain-containing protein n=1 Tax=Rehmannia glutinosa TaxID=99300 RepID=A0ABR0VPU6_REHGL
MGYENDPYRDEDGEPLMDFDEDIQSDQDEPHQHLLDDGDDAAYDRESDPQRQCTMTRSRPRKRLIKKSSSSKESGPLDFGLDDDEGDVGGDYGGDEDDMAGMVRENYSDGGKSKRERGEMRKSVDKKRKVEKGEKKFKVRKSGGGRMRDHEADPEMKEMWDTVGVVILRFALFCIEILYSLFLQLWRWNSVVWNCFYVLYVTIEDDQEGVRNLDDDNFIDDSGVDPAHRYGSDNEHSPSRAPQREIVLAICSHALLSNVISIDENHRRVLRMAEEGEEDDEIKELFKMGKKKKKNEKSAAEIALLVENVMAELEVVAEEDAELNRQGKPAINKLKKLSLLEDVLSKKQLQQEFLDHGVLTLLKNWLEPLPDGSLPNINIRAAVLKILNDVIMFLSKSDEETTSNRKLAKELVDKWSRPIFNKSTRFEDMKNFEDERAFRRPPAKKYLLFPQVMSKAAGMSSRDDDLDLAEFSHSFRLPFQGSKSSQSSSRQHASRPEAMSMDFVVRPQSKVDPDEIRARAKQVVQDQRRVKDGRFFFGFKLVFDNVSISLGLASLTEMNKKLQQLKAPKRKQLQATKLSVEGRGMVKYL